MTPDPHQRTWVLVQVPWCGIGAGSVVVPAEGREAMLLCRVRGHLCGLPLAHVVETMRPLGLEPLGGMPTFVLGVSLIRGDAVPVVDPGTLLGFPEPARASRFVLLRTGRRRVAVAVEGVVGIRDVPRATLKDLPPLMGQANTDVVTALSTLDAELLLVLHAARLLPESSSPVLPPESAAP